MSTMFTLSLYSLAGNLYVFSVSQFLVNKFDCWRLPLLFVVCLSLLRIEMFSIWLSRAKENRIASFSPLNQENTGTLGPPLYSTYILV